jgi:hypothetical protein
MLHKIKQDEQSGICKKWQDKYKKLSKATKQDKDKANDEEDSSEDQFEVDADARCTRKFNVAFNLSVDNSIK